MSRSFGSPGHHAHEATRKNMRYFLILLVAIAVIAHLAGFTAGLAITSPALSYIPLALLIALLWVAKRRVSNILADLQAAAIAFRKGADGLILTADTLANLPDTYTVFHDFTHPDFGGTIDHLVVGPSGIFAIDARDWRGMVTLAGQGTLTIDNKHNQTPAVIATLERARKIRLTIEALTHFDSAVQAVMVFPHASVHVLPGTRCSLAVQRLDRLVDYIVKPVHARQLSPQQTAAITCGLLTLFKPAPARPASACQDQD